MRAAVGGAEWQLVSITTGKDATLRVYVWRQLRRLGAVYLHKSVCVLPNRPEVRDALEPVLLRIQAHGGTVRNLTIRISGPDHDALVAEQRNERDDEYGEVVDRVPQFLSEITMETARGRANYTEVEESEADLERFEKWLAAIAARDYFQAPGAAAARSAVQQCRDALAAFEAAALAAEFGDGETDRHPESPIGLTAVEDLP
jgi:Protein ChrB, N-terminal